MTNARKARAYFERLARIERSRAALARREAAAETDPALKRNLEALADGHEQQAAIYDKRRDEVK